MHKHNFGPTLKLKSAVVTLVIRSRSSKSNFLSPNNVSMHLEGAQWLSGRVLDSRPRGRGFEPHRRHCVVVLEKRHIYSSLVLVQPRKTRPCLTERLLMRRKESNQTKTKYANLKEKTPLVQMKELRKG